MTVTDILKRQGRSTEVRIADAGEATDTELIAFARDASNESVWGAQVARFDTGVVVTLNID